MRSRAQKSILSRNPAGVELWLHLPNKNLLNGVYKSYQMPTSLKLQAIGKFLATKGPRPRIRANLKLYSLAESLNCGLRLTSDHRTTVANLQISWRRHRLHQPNELRLFHLCQSTQKNAWNYWHHSPTIVLECWLQSVVDIAEWAIPKMERKWPLWRTWASQ